MRCMTKAHAPTLVPYSTASDWFEVSVSALRRRVADGRLTRHTDPRDERRTLLDLGELAEMFGPLNQPLDAQEPSLNA